MQSTRQKAAPLYSRGGRSLRQYDDKECQVSEASIACQTKAPFEFIQPTRKDIMNNATAKPKKSKKPAKKTPAK